MTCIQNSTKRQKLEFNQYFLPKNLMEHMTLYLDKLSLINFEFVAKSHASTTSLAWKELNKRSGYKMEWLDCEGIANKEKFKFVFSCVTVRLFHLRGLRTVDHISRIDKQFQSLKRFKHFGAFLEVYIASKKNDKLEIDQNLQEKLNSLANTALSGNKNKQYGGDIGLHAFVLSLIGQTPSEQHITKAIKNQAIFTYELIPPTVETAMATAEVQHFHILNFFLNTRSFTYDQLLAFSKKYQRFPPLLVHMAKTLHQENSIPMEQLFKEKEKLLMEAYANWKSNAVLIPLIDAKFSLYKINEVEALFKKVDPPSLGESAFMMYLKVLLIKEKYEKIDEEVNKILNSNHNFSKKFIYYFALTSALRQKKYKDPQTKILYDLAFKNRLVLGLSSYIIYNIFNDKAFCKTFFEQTLQEQGMKNTFQLCFSGLDMPTVHITLLMNFYSEFFSIEQLYNQACEFNESGNHDSAFILYGICYLKIKNSTSPHLNISPYLNDVNSKIQNYLEGNLISENLQPIKMYILYV